MLFDNIDHMKSAGFSGFVTVENLISSGCREVPAKPGVYFVLYLSETVPQFREKSTGGFFEGQDPTIPISVLKSSWTQGTKVIYIGKAGGGDFKATLQSRLKQYMRFGQGAPVGHRGGRYIWQLPDPRGLVVCWKVMNDARQSEAALLEEFQREYGRLPFATLRA